MKILEKETRYESIDSVLVDSDILDDLRMVINVIWKDLGYFMVSVAGFA